MCLSAMRKVCVPAAQGNKIQGFREDVKNQCLHYKVRGTYASVQGPWFTIMPLSVIKKEHQQQTSVFTSSFISLPSLTFCFSILFNFLH